jgi:NAD(P)-dependent dehydrogenase (short-subunit alcohol dehydrogenase family)
MAKPFTQFTADDFRSLSSTNLDGFLHVTQRVVEQMLEQKRGGSVVSITSSLRIAPDRAIAGRRADDYQGRHQRELAQPRDGVRQARNTREHGVAGVVGYASAQGLCERFSGVSVADGTARHDQDICRRRAVSHEAPRVTGVVLNVDCGAHLGSW